MALLESDTITNSNIGSAAQTIGSYTADAARWVAARVHLNGLANAAATLTFRLNSTPSGGSVHYGVRFSDAKDATGLTVYWAEIGPVWVNNGDALALTCLSSNSSDNSADGTVEWIDVMPLQPTTAGRTLDVASTGEAEADVVKVSGDATAADNLEAILDGTGGVTLVASAFTLTTPIQANTIQLSGDATAADNAESFFDGTGYAGTNNVIPTVTLTQTVTTYTGNTPQTGDAFARLGAPAGASVSADVAAVKTDTGNLVTRITSTLFSGITSLAEWLGLLAGKQTGNSTARTELRATGAGSGTFDETADSQEAIRDRGDAAWTTTTVNTPNIEVEFTEIRADD